VTMLSERSERAAAAPRDRGDAEARARVADELRVDPDRVAIAPSLASIHLALFYVLADPGDEVLVIGASDTLAGEAARISGLDVQSLDAIDAEALFESAGERTRAIVLDDAAIDPEVIELLAELDVPILSTNASLARHAIFQTEHAPLVAVLGERDRIAWLALLGPADRAEPLMTRLDPFAHVFFARAGA